MTFLFKLLPGAVFIVLLALHNVNHQDLSKTNRGPVGQTGLALWAAPKNPEACTDGVFNPSCKCTQMFCVGWQGPNPFNGMSWWKTPHAGIDRDLLRHAYNFFVHLLVRINQFFVDSCVLTALISMADKWQQDRLGSFFFNITIIFFMYLSYMGGYFLESYCKYINPIYYLNGLYTWCPLAREGSSVAMFWYMDKNEAAFKGYVVMLFWQVVQVVFARIMIVIYIMCNMNFEFFEFLQGWNYFCSFCVFLVCLYQLDDFYEMANILNLLKQKGWLMLIYGLFAFFCFYDCYVNYGKTLQQIKEQTGTWKLEYYACLSNPVTTESQAATGNLMNIPGVENWCTDPFGGIILTRCTVSLGCKETESVIRGWYSPDQFWNMSVRNPMHDQMLRQMFIYAVGFFLMFNNGEEEKKPKVEVFEIIVWLFSFCVEKICTILSWWGCDVNFKWWGCDVNFKATGNKASPQKAGGNDDDMMPAGTSITAKGVEVKHLKALLKAKNLSVSYRKKDDLIKRLQLNNIKQF